MKRRVVLAGVLLLIVGGGALFAWVEYSRADMALSMARTNVGALEKYIVRDRNIPMAAGNYNLAKSKVDALAAYRFWIGGEEIEALQKELAALKAEIDAASAAER